MVVVFLLAIAVIVATAGGAISPSVIVVGAGMSGISAAKTLSDAGITNITILEATGQVGGRLRKFNFAGINVEVGANWIEGMNGKMMNPIWPMAEKLNLTRVFSDYSNISANTYLQTWDVPINATAAFDRADKVAQAGETFAMKLSPSGVDDISILTFQRINNSVPATPLEMAVDYYNYDYEFAEPPRLTSLQNTHPLPTFANFGEDLYFVADERGYESIVLDLAKQFLVTNPYGDIADPRLKLNQVVCQIICTKDNVTVITENNETYTAEYVMVSPSIGVLQSNLIKFTPPLPAWKIMAIDQFDMAVYTKIFLEFPYRFWPSSKGTNFFIYASERRGYYPIWQHFAEEYGANSAVLMVTVTDEESRRIEQQSDRETMEEAMAVLRDMFGNNIPNATNIHVPTWWSNKFFRGSFSNWPLGVNRYEFDLIRAPVGRVYFTGEHTSAHYNGYVHGAHLAGIDSASMLVACVKQGLCDVKVLPKTT